MTRRQRGKVATLERRLKFLEWRIPTYTVPERADRDKAEAAALTWALTIVHGAERYSILGDLEALA